MGNKLESAGIDFRTYAKLSKRQVREVLPVTNRPKEQLTPKQHKKFAEVIWQQEKRQNRLQNIGMMKGRAHTSNGQTFFRR